LFVLEFATSATSLKKSGGKMWQAVLSQQQPNLVLQVVGAFEWF
jgi:hypothetical protein